MGDIFNDGWFREQPVHRVCLDGYYIGKYEVTQKQYKQITGNNPSDNASFFRNTDNYPVIQVSWNDTQSYIEALNSKGDFKFRLPTEAEWEYAARSRGKRQKFPGSNDIDSVAWYKLNSDESYDPEKWKDSTTSYFESDDYIKNYEDSLIHPVGLKQPSSLGIYDMAGNAYEWCSDWYSKHYYSSSPTDNPQGAEEQDAREKVMRGGSWHSDSWNCRTTYRMRQLPFFRNFTTGFRLVLIPPKK